jgi:hypothetical protein
MAGRDAERTAERAAKIVGGSAGLAGLIQQYLIGGPLYQLALSIIAAIDGAALVFLAPFRAFGNGLAQLVGAVVESPISIIERSADYTAFVITTGDWGFFGPATFAVGVAATFAGLFIAVKALRRIELRPWRIFRSWRR